MRLKFWKKKLCRDKECLQPVYRFKQADIVDHRLFKYSGVYCQEHLRRLNHFGEFITTLSI